MRTHKAAFAVLTRPPEEKRSGTADQINNETRTALLLMLGREGIKTGFGNSKLLWQVL